MPGSTKGSRPPFPGRAALWRRAGLAVGAAALALALAVVTVSGYTAWSLSRAKRFPLIATPATAGLAYREAAFPSAEDAVLLKGWYIPATTESARVVIIVHGRDGNRAKRPDSPELPVAKELAQRGFSVLLFDLRGHGESGGERFSLGQFEERDVRGAIAYARSLGFAPGRIGVLGYSTGAAAALLAASRAPEVGAVITDSAFASAREMLEKEFPKESGLPPVFLPPSLLMARLAMGVDVDSVAPERAVAEVGAPVLVIQGEEDALVPVGHARRIYAAARNPASGLWLVPGAGHTRAYRQAPADYVARVADFFERNLR